MGVKVGAGCLYEWLRDYRQLEDDIAYLEFNLEKTEHELWRWTSGDLYGVKLQHDSLGAKVENRIEDIKSELATKIEQRDKLLVLIGTFKGIEHRILKLKYVDGLTLDEVAERLNYSSSHIKKRHAELVRTIKFVEAYEGSL